MKYVYDDIKIELELPRDILDKLVSAKYITALTDCTPDTIYKVYHVKDKLNKEISALVTRHIQEIL